MIGLARCIAMVIVWNDLCRGDSEYAVVWLLSILFFRITLCGHADEHCPVITNHNVTKWHWGFDDPAKAT